MPYTSRRQQRWANATAQPFAQRWNKLTTFDGLPEHKDAGTPLAGPGGLLGTPGMGTPRRKGHKWGARLKDKQIKGKLYRANDGKFSAGNGGAASDAPPSFGKRPKKPRKARSARGRAAKPKQTPEQRAAATQAKRAQNADDVAKRMAEQDAPLSPSGTAALQAFADGTPPSAAMGAGLTQMGLAEQAADGSYRMTPTGHAAVSAMQAGDYQRTIDAISRGTDAQGRRTQRQTERTARQAAAAEKKQQTAARRAEVAARRAAKLSAKKQPKAASGGKKKPAPVPANAKPAKAAPRHARVTAPNVGGVAGAAANKKPVTAPKAPAKQIAPALQEAVQQVSAGRVLPDAELQALQQNGLIRIDKNGLPILTAAGQRASMKSFLVFKDAHGTHRWIARTTTAYRDRDGEIISEAALDADSQRMTATKQFGPLRYWHIGQPDPLSDTAPWGPGVDIGMCDYSIVIGRTRIESGTFKSADIARKMAAVADDHEMSPGFLYTPDQPDADGVFTNIRTFERSPVPRRYARASNLFTGFAVKEHTMELAEMERRFKAMYQELGLSPAQGVELGQQLVATEKSAQAQGIAFKEQSAPDEITINGVVYAVKAAAAPPEPPTAVPLDAGMVETKAPGDEMTEDVTLEGTPDEMAQDQGDYLGDMNVSDFEAMLQSLLAPLIKALDISGKMAGHVEELKSMMGGVATKEAGTQAEIAALKARLAQIEGDQPATVLPDEIAAALKSEGPATNDPDATEAPADATRPFAQIAARLTALYKNGPDGGFAGWTPPPAAG